MTDVVSSKPDVHDMVVVHRTFRRSCAELPDLVRGLRPGDTARAGLVVDAVRFMLMGLEAHHVSEDEFLWPRLAARAVVRAEAITRMEEQHHRLEELVTQVRGALGREWRFLSLFGHGHVHVYVYVYVTRQRRGALNASRERDFSGTPPTSRGGLTPAGCRPQQYHTEG